MILRLKLIMSRQGQRTDSTSRIMQYKPFQIVEIELHYY